jgi:hypothetical protein
MLCGVISWGLILTVVLLFSFFNLLKIKKKILDGIVCIYITNKIFHHFWNQYYLTMTS